MTSVAGVMRFANRVMFVFPTELRDGRDGVGAIHSLSAAGKFIH